MYHVFQGRPGEKGLQDHQFDCLKRLIRTVAHRLFHEERNIIIVDILVVHGRCHGDKLPQISGLKKMSVIQACHELLDINFISQAEIPKERFNPNTGMMDIVRNSTQQVYFINYPGALDTIRFAVHQMELHVQKFVRSAQDDEETLYYCPPRTVTRKELEQQKSGKKKDKGTFVEVTKDVNIGCANSRDSDRRDKRYRYAEYMKAQVRELNPDTGAYEYRHYCPWCLDYAKKQNKLTVDHQGRLTLPVLVPYIGAAVGIEELDEILAPIRLLLENKDLDPERIHIPIEVNGSLFEGAMDKFQTEQRDRERMQKSRHSGNAERVQQSVRVTLTDSTRIIAEDTTVEEKSLADKKHDYVVESRLRVLKSGSISRIMEGLTPKVREPKHVCDCHEPKQSFENADKLKEHVDKVDKEVRALTKRARLDGQFFIEGSGDAVLLHNSCTKIAADSARFLNCNGERVHYSQITRADIAAMSPEEYQRFADSAPLLLGESTSFLPEKGALVFGMNAAGQFLSGSFSSATDVDF